MNALIMVPLEASSVVRVISMFILFIAISAVLAFLERYCLSVFAGTTVSLSLTLEHVTIRFRKEYLKAVLRHDVDFIESISPGRLGQRFSEESSRLVTGLGPDLGTMIRFVTSMVTGSIIGFVYVFSLICGDVTELATHPSHPPCPSHRGVLWMAVRKECGGLH